MKRKGRGRPAPRPAPPAGPAVPPPQKPLAFLIFGAVAASAVAVGIVVNLFRPLQPLTAGAVLVNLALAGAAAWMAYRCGRAVRQRADDWRKPGD